MTLGRQTVYTLRTRKYSKSTVASIITDTVCRDIGEIKRRYFSIKPDGIRNDGNSFDRTTRAKLADILGVVADDVEAIGKDD